MQEILAQYLPTLVLDYTDRIALFNAEFHTSL